MSDGLWSNVLCGATGAAVATAGWYGAMNYWPGPTADQPVSAVNAWWNAKMTGIGDYFNQVGANFQQGFTDPTFWPVLAGLGFIGAGIGYYLTRPK